jgi:CheY-like chemotaxis protein
MASKTRELLFADASEGASAIGWCLSDCELTRVRTFAEAVAKLGENVFSMVLIDLRFAESRMLELVEHVRSLTEYRDVPVVCVLRTKVPPSAAEQKKINVAVKALGGKAFVSLCGEGQAMRQACQYLRQILAFEVGLPISPMPPCA